MELSALHFAADIIGHCISCEVFGCSEQIAPIKIRQFGLQFMNLEGDIVDTCDACGREADRLDLKRCGRCKVAHYCDSEHQKIAWKVDTRTFASRLELGAFGMELSFSSTW